MVKHESPEGGKKKSKAAIRDVSKHTGKGTKLRESCADEPSLQFEEHVDDEGNVVENPYLLKVLELMRTIPEWSEFFSRDDDACETRVGNWIRLEVLGQPLIDHYSWAIPNKRALNIIKHFSPIIEIGAGRGYWASLLRHMGVEVQAYDRLVFNVPQSAQNGETGSKRKKQKELPKLWTVVKQGDARMLMKKCFKRHTLMLCYPDEDSELSMDCLERYDGEYLIHVGELVTTGTYSGGAQAPFGRTTCSQFQINLLQYFHCILVAELPCFPFSKDCITVWKRTVFVPGRSAYGPQHRNADDDDQDHEHADGVDHEDPHLSHAVDADSEEDPEAVEHADGDGHDAEDESDDDCEDCWADLPRVERLPMDRAATELAFLLVDDEDSTPESDRIEEAQ